MAERRPAEAVGALEDAIACHCPGRREMELELARAHLIAGEFEKSLEILGRLLRARSDDVAALKLKGQIAFLLERDDEAAAALIRALELDPSDEQAAYLLGRVYYYQNWFDLAIAQFQRVLRRNPNSYKAHDNLGLCYDALGKEELAIRHFLAAIRLVDKEHPGYDWPYANLARLLINRGEYKKAFSLALEAARRNPRSARDYYLAARALVKAKQFDKAVRWLERSVELDPDYLKARYLLGQVYVQLGRQEEAQREFEVCRRLAPRADLPPR